MPPIIDSPHFRIALHRPEEPPMPVEQEQPVVESRQSQPEYVQVEPSYPSDLVIEQEREEVKQEEEEPEEQPRMWFTPHYIRTTDSPNGNPFWPLLALGGWLFAATTL